MRFFYVMFVFIMRLISQLSILFIEVVIFKYVYDKLIEADLGFIAIPLGVIFVIWLIIDTISRLIIGSIKSLVEYINNV